MNTKIFLTLLLSGLLFGTVLSRDFNRNKLDSFFNILAEKNKAMGSLTISKNGTVLYSKTIGYSFISDVEKRLSTNNTKYRIGSITKIFTAVMIFQLVEEGKITLKTTLDTYFPNLPNAKKISISNLLNHRSGLHNFTDDPGYLTWMTQPKTQNEMLAVISCNKVDFQPNEKVSYSNSNYIVLGYIIEMISKKPYSKCLNDRILSKIGLTNTYCGGKTDIGTNESFSYIGKIKWEQQPETEMSIFGGAGSIVSTPADLSKFIESLFSLKLVSQMALNQMKSITDGFGMGIVPIPFYNRKAYGHGGHIDGFSSILAYFPEDGTAISFCTNGLFLPFNDILIGVLSIYYDKEYPIPTFKPLALKSEDMNKYLGVYSNTSIPLKITITKNDTIIVAQATGQSSFPLVAAEKDRFNDEQGGIFLEFNTVKNEMILKQGGGIYLFVKEK